ncbi:MAG: P1 family peptidase [Myxococcales bacterium]|nr:P1 family peptidase [Myxococcales bacterium]MCB9750025.1 P1 family peptidase [Myxococcales bacterium]
MPSRSTLTRRTRARKLGIEIGRFSPGRYNAITDVTGVRVGHSTVSFGEGPLVAGVGPARTGVTVILPNGGNIFESRVIGSGFILNGAGEVSGLTQVHEWGLIETPIVLTNTMSVGTCSEAIVKYMVDRYPGIGDEFDVVIPVVGECDDSWLNDAAGRHVRHEHVFEAIEAARTGPVQEGAVGGGTGMITCDFKAGIGTSSRKLPLEEGGFVVGVLVMSNFGHMRDLRVDGVPVGRLLEPEYADYLRRIDNYGSIIAVIATTAPLLPHQLHRLCKRVALGIGRTGSHAAHGSGEIIVGFSTANAVPRRAKGMVYRVKALLDVRMNALYEAAIEATEEAIINSLCMAETTTGHSDHVAPALPLERVRELVRAYRPTFQTPR